MGLWFFQGFGDADTMLVEEIAKEHKLDVEIVEKHYKIMLENIDKELKMKQNVKIFKEKYFNK